MVIRMTSGGPAAVSGRVHIPRIRAMTPLRTTMRTPRSKRVRPRSRFLSGGNSVHNERDRNALLFRKLAGLHIEVERVLSGRETRGFEIEEKFRRSFRAGGRPAQQRDVRRTLCSRGVADLHRKLQPFR